MHRYPVSLLILKNLPFQQEKQDLALIYTTPKEFFSMKMLPEKEKEHRFTWIELT